jgi:hypothetical protein
LLGDRQRRYAPHAVFTYTYDSLGRQTGVEGPEDA